MTKKLTLTCLALAASLSLSCYTQRYVIGNGASTSVANKTDKRWDLHFFWGLVGTSRVPVQCANAVVITKQTAANAIVKGLTAGIVAPSTTTVYCAAQ